MTGGKPRGPEEFGRRTRMEKLERRMRERNRGKVQGRRWLKRAN